MSDRTFRVLAALSGILGVALLGLYYSEALIPLPPPNATSGQVAEFGTRYHDAILLDAWLQGTGSVLLVVFTLAVVHLARSSAQFAVRLFMMASGVLLAVALAEATFGVGAAEAGALGHAQTVQTSFDLTFVFGHIFLIVPAPLFFLTPGAVLLGSHLLPRLFGYLAVALGVAFEILGLAGLFNGTAAAASTFLLIGQEIWIVAAAIVLVVRPRETREVVSLREHAHEETDTDAERKAS